MSEQATAWSPSQVTANDWGAASDYSASVGRPQGMSKELVTFVERIERLEEEKSVLTEDTKEVYAEVKAAGFNAKTLRTVIRRRRMDDAKRAEQDQLIATYEGVLEGTR